MARGDAARRRGRKVLVDDALWLDLVHAGYQPGHGVIWFYKADLDPAVEAAPRLAGPRLRRLLADRPPSTSGLTLTSLRRERLHGLHTFGTGDDRIEIRKVEKELMTRLEDRRSWSRLRSRRPRSSRWSSRPSTRPENIGELLRQISDGVGPACRARSSSSTTPPTTPRR